MQVLPEQGSVQKQASLALLGRSEVLASMCEWAMAVALSPLFWGPKARGGRGTMEHDKCKARAGRLRVVCRRRLLISDQYDRMS